jgi:hypothetical protein
MLHDARCRQFTLATEGSNHCSDCEECRKLFESDSSHCPHCWKPVSNAVYFGKRGKSMHLDGKCAEKQTSIPASFLARKSTAPRHVDPTPGYWQSSKDAMESYRAYESSRRPSQITRNVCAPSPVVVPIQSEPVPVVDPLAEQLVKLLEEQNRLLRQLTRKAA